MVAHQAEAEIARWGAGGTAAGAGIPNEIRDIGAMRALCEPNAAIGPSLESVPGIVAYAAREAGAGPFPAIADKIGKAVFIAAEAAEHARCAVLIGPGFALIARDPALGRIVVVRRKFVIFKFAGGGVGSFGIGGQPVAVAGLVRQSCRIGFGIMPIDVHGGTVQCDGDVGAEQRADMTCDAGLIVNGADLLLQMVGALSKRA
jgi:hypothetical protein